MKIFFAVLVLLSLGFSAIAQSTVDTSNTENIKVFARAKNGVVELRWYPANIGAWRKANVTGYTVKRKSLSDNNEADFKVVAQTKPYPNNDARFASGDDYMKLTQKTIYTTSTEKNFADRDNEENEMFFGYVFGTSISANAARSAGLLFTDDKVEAGKDYAYMVSINPGKGKQTAGDEVLSIVTNISKTYEAPAVQQVTLEEGEGYVKLAWDFLSNNQMFTVYNIERSSDGGKTFSRINKTAFTSVTENAENIFYTDSVRNYIPYQYRVIGITAWTDAGTPSIVLSGMGKDRTGASPPTNVKADGDRSKITVSWELPVTSEDLTGFKIARSHLLEGPYHALNDKLLSTKERNFIDSKPIPSEPFYAVYSVDSANNINSTFSVMANIYDTTGPAKPLTLKGFIDSTGLVNLNWQFGNDNDLLGYQVYMANGKDNIYRQITSSPLVDSVITDTVTMRSLTEEVYYKITAIDYNNNASEYSEILVLKRPDIIPPAAPVIIRYQVIKNTANLEWANSQSTDVMKHAVYRMEEGKAEMLLKEFRDTTSTFVDEDIISGKNYTYFVKAFDDAGLVSASDPLRISTAEESEMPGIEKLKADYDHKDKNVKLVWKYDQKGEYEFVLFRAKDSQPLQAYKKISATNNVFEETAEAGIYNYAVKVIYASGAESPLSSSVKVEAQ